MDRQSVFSTQLYHDAATESQDSNSQVRTLLESFILDFRLDNIFIYRSAPAPAPLGFLRLRVGGASG